MNYSQQFERYLGAFRNRLSRLTVSRGIAALSIAALVVPLVAVAAVAGLAITSTRTRAERSMAAVAVSAVPASITAAASAARPAAPRAVRRVGCGSAWQGASEMARDLGSGRATPHLGAELRQRSVDSEALSPRPAHQSKAQGEPDRGTKIPHRISVSDIELMQWPNACRAGGWPR